MRRLIVFLLWGFLGAGAVNAQIGEYGSFSWVFEDGVLTISENGSGDAIPDYFLDMSTFNSVKNDVRSIILDEGITGIGSNAFQSSLITSISIPASVMVISNDAFLICEGLTSITVASTNMVFSSDEGILFNKGKTTLIAFPEGKSGSYVIPESVEIIGDYAFAYCTKLISVTIPASVKTIGAFAFFICKSLNSMLIPATVTTIGVHAFFSCNLNSIIIPSSVISIGEGAFGGCLNLNTVTILDGVTAINRQTFFGCKNLTYITIPASVISIGEEVFAHCENLSEIVNLNLTPQVISPNVFTGVDLNACLLRVYDVTAYKNADEWMVFKNIVALDAQVTLDKEVIYLLKNTTATLTATVTGGMDLSDVIWNNDNPGIAIVDSGTITALSTGCTMITVSIGQSEAICTVTVIQPGKSSIEGTVSNAGIENLFGNLKN